MQMFDVEKLHQELEDYYNTDEGFKDFVDKCAKTYNKDKDMILRYPITAEYYKDLKKRKEEKKTKKEG